MTPPFGYEWAYGHPASTFPDSLRRNGQHTSGRVVKYSRPIGEEGPGRPRRKYFMGSFAGELLPGEFDDLEAAYAAVLDVVQRS
jgi:hypothetical protein